MTIVITTSQGEKVFNKDVITAGTNPNCDVILNTGYDVLLTMEYKIAENKCSIINTFKNDKVLFKGQPIKRVDVTNICKIMFGDSEEFLAVKVIADAPSSKPVKTITSIGKEDLTEEDIKKGCYTWVPLTLLVDGEEIIDDETFDQADFLAKVAASKESVKSACPAPESYMEAYSKADDIYVVTLSAELSGSYNSAVLGKTLYEEDHGKKNIHVVNSRGAATTQVLIARKIYEYASQGMPFEEVVEKIEEYTTSLRTYFVLETLEVLRKNGRLSRLSATIASALNIKPVMIGTRDGIIQKAGQARGMKKALAKMVEYMASEGRDLSGRQFVISHCNCYERAVFVKELIQKNLHAQDVDIVDTKGVSSMYACDGGIIVSY